MHALLTNVLTMISSISGKLFLNPRYGSELGGTPIIVSGSKLTVSENDNVTCVFDARETEGFVIDVREVFCVSPELSRTGRVPFKIYIEGEENSFTGIAIYISCECHVILLYNLNICGIILFSCFLHFQWLMTKLLRLHLKMKFLS